MSNVALTLKALNPLTLLSDPSFHYPLETPLSIAAYDYKRGKGISTDGCEKMLALPANTEEGEESRCLQFQE